MQTFHLHHRDRTLLYAGDYRTLAECVEDALRDGVDLRGIDLAHADLREVNLDGADLRGASFAGANLTGANLSEASLEEIQFNRSSLFNACLCGSTLSASDFSGALFGGTDIADCDLGECRFSGRSALGLHFAESRSMSGCSFTHGSIISAMAQPPVVVQGLHLITALFDDDILIGQAVYACTRGIWRLREGRSDPGSVLPHELFRIVSLLQTLRPDHSPHGCIAMQKSTER